MPEPPFDLQQAHRWFAIEFNNATWDLLESDDRSADDEARMLHLAHTASLHWHEVGTAINDQRAEYLLCKVYLALSKSESAFVHAERGMKLSESIGDEQTAFDRSTALEAMGRAHAARGNQQQATKLKQQALEAADKLDAEDRQVFDDLFDNGSWAGE